MQCAHTHGNRLSSTGGSSMPRLSLRFPCQALLSPSRTGSGNDSVPHGTTHLGKKPLLLGRHLHEIQRYVMSMSCPWDPMLSLLKQIYRQKPPQCGLMWLYQPMASSWGTPNANYKFSLCEAASKHLRSFVLFHPVRRMMWITFAFLFSLTPSWWWGYSYQWCPPA